MITREWSAPLEQYAERPEPLSCHCFVRFDPFRAILFGGGYEDGKRNETRVFDLREKTFSGPLNFSEPCPTGRAYTTLTPLIDPLTLPETRDESVHVVRQKMLLLWGKELNDVILTDSWILELDVDNNHFSWTQLDINTYARAWHIAGATYSHNSTACLVAIFGGNVHWDGFNGRRRNIGDVRLARFGMSSLSGSCARTLIKDSRDESIFTCAFPPHSPSYIALERAKYIETHENSMLTVTGHNE